MSDVASCPLCANPGSDLKKTLDVDDIARRWEESFGFDVRGEFQGVSQFVLRQCKVCMLQFFKPDCVAGSPSLYEKLDKLQSYYMPRKWEHDVALEDLNDCKNGLEIGCGFGEFVARVEREKGILFEGCEQNPSAVSVAQKNGVPVRLDSSETLAKDHPAEYDAVCSFQVLEHVTHPASFLQAACRLIRPKGKLILGLPNAKSFLRHQFNLLDLPPHHMTRWTPEVLFRLQSWFPLKLDRIALEPLASYHVEGYIDIYLGLLASRRLRILSRPELRSLLMWLINDVGMRRFLMGQTVYACYTRA